MEVTAVTSNPFVIKEEEIIEKQPEKKQPVSVPIGGKAPLSSVDSFECTTIKTQTTSPEKFDVKNDKDITEWRKQTEKRPSAESTLKAMDADKSISKEEKYEKLKEVEKQYIEEDTAFLKEKFEKNPELRVKMQENFDKLTAREQKALLNEAYTRETKDGEVKKLDKSEVDRFMKGLRSDKTTDEVKTLVIAALRSDERVPQSCVDRLEKELNITEEQIADRLPQKNRAEAAAVVDNIMSDENATPKAHKIVAEKLHKCHKDMHAFGVKCFTKSKYIGGEQNAEAREAFIKTLPKFETEVQNSAVKYIKQFESFNTEKDMQALKSVMPELKLNDEVRKMAEDFTASVKETSVSESPVSNIKNSELENNSPLSNIANSVLKNVAENPKPATILAFTTMMAAGVIKPEMVISAGYANVLSSYFSDFSRDLQEKIFNTLSRDQRVAMFEKGKLAPTFTAKLMEELKGSKSLDVASARDISHTASREELQELNGNYSDVVNNIFAERLQAMA